MASTFTPNIQLEEPARGDLVGTWDTPVNNNETLIDLVAGGITTISGSPGNVVLAAAQFQAKTITFNSTLVGSITVTFPTSFHKSYEVRNSCTGSSAFVITLGTTAAGGQVISCPPGESIDVVNNGTDLYFHNFGRVGSYWDYAGSSVPLWVTTCTVPPYLPCDGSTFASSTYPVLAVTLGSTTTPDSRGRGRYALDAGAGRVSSAVSGVAGNTRFAGGGDQSLQAHTHVNTLTDPTHGHTIGSIAITPGGAGPALANGGGNIANAAQPAATGITINNVSAGAGGSQNMPPVYVGGITMIRAG